VAGPPNAVDDTSSGPFNQPQSDSVLSDDSAATGATLVPSTLTLMDGSTPVTSLTVTGLSTNADGTTTTVTQGVYTLGPNNTIIFTPEPGFVGIATPVTYQITDSLGQSATATYTPTIDPPADPRVVPDTSVNQINTVQVKDVIVNDQSFTGVAINASTLMIWDESIEDFVNYDQDGNPIKIFVDEGSYHIENGRIHFTPNENFVGTATPVTYQVADSWGRVASTTYTPTVLPVSQPRAGSPAQVAPPIPTIEPKITGPSLPATGANRPDLLLAFATIAILLGLFIRLPIFQPATAAHRRRSKHARGEQ
jgi:CshA-type fibril repeat protein